ncbi:MAG: hypothetical protein JW833_04030, partial [Prolixibacteraceae bacterium]|nr:hypothetical protein [Prolixibacteraceae bacterium]
YPHGCIEQTTSAVFPQLFLDKLNDMDAAQKQDVQDNIKYALQRLMAFQLNDGGFSYWPGGNYANDWGTSYAGHFMILAEQNGYSLPVGMKNKWIRYQQNRARSWNRQAGFRNGIFYKGHELDQAYRLYTLALAGTPDLSSMNRLREVIKTSTAIWRLAAAYLLAGQASAAGDLLAGENSNVEDYNEFGGTYGSGLRDQAMILETLILQKDSKNSFVVLKEISDELNQRNWLSTQTAAWCFYAASQFIGDMNNKPEMNIQAEINGKKEDFKTSVPFIRFPVDSGDKTVSVKVQNKGEGMVYTRLLSRGTPLQDDGTGAENNMSMEIWYTDKSGNRIDPVELYQGDDLIMNVKVKHPGIRGNYENMALTGIIPSGWEILNQRLNDVPADIENNFEYQDIRDDRIYTYFDLPQNSVRTFKFRLSASYEGKFYLPAVSCEAMYDNSVYARQPGKWVEVKKR